MTARPLVAALLAVSALGVAACGGAAPAQTNADAKAKIRQAELKFARCMRGQGIDFPDPSSSGRGFQKVGGKGSPEQMRRAEQACKKYRAAIKPPQLSEADQAAFKRAALANARCMRAHGIDMPDPIFDKDGAASVRIGKGGVKPDDAAFRAAAQACEKTAPMKVGKP
jgi:hypothetical protein